LLLLSKNIISENHQCYIIRGRKDPFRTYRDSADVAVALGELKSGKQVRSEHEVVVTEQPSRKGGRTAATSSISSLQHLLRSYLEWTFLSQKASMH